MFGHGCGSQSAMVNADISAGRSMWCPGRDLNPHSPCGEKDFKSEDITSPEVSGDLKWFVFHALVTLVVTEQNMLSRPLATTLATILATILMPPTSRFG